MRLVRTAGLAALAALAVGATPSPPPVRVLTYSFTYTNVTTETIHDSGINAPHFSAPVSGIAESRGADSDIGTITVDVMRAQPDSGLVVSISEDARGHRSARPATCVVYGNTNVICDPNVRINTEELSVLRLLGSNFVDTNQIDAKNHWRVDQGGTHMSDVADFTIDSNRDGMLRISSTRVLREIDAIGFVSTTDALISYDWGRLVPTNISDDETIRQPGSLDRYSTVRTQTSLTLIHDSAATTP